MDSVTELASVVTPRAGMSGMHATYLPGPHSCLHGERLKYSHLRTEADVLPAASRCSACSLHRLVIIGQRPGNMYVNNIQLAGGAYKRAAVHQDLFGLAVCKPRNEWQRTSAT
jgi:hypothetical protein